ncbi:uncharacterized protein LOC127705290 [Mytilus californianus]|uniref:uncharacterized protein LOC127705290 n=1 Tax=Mytilus californianus TaxID=6549 RepID=UPI0022479E5D|nr:uncharacterized protein LOC127705290 [Mytilus californianus]
MYSSQLLPCKNDRKRTSTGSSSVCSVRASPAIATQDINPEIQRFILQNYSHISKAVEFLVKQRNSKFAHVPEAKKPDSDFRLFLKDIENHLLGIARVCGKETHVKKILRDLHLKPLSLNMLRKYEKLLHKNMEAINKNINLQYRITRQSIPKLVDKSNKIRKIEERVDELETSVAKITEEVQDLSKIIKERSKRQRLIDQTSAEIESHKKAGTYIEVETVRHCIQLLESKHVVILSGREGSGKSRNGLEILRQLKEKNKDFDVFKLIGLTYVSDIVKCNVTSIVLFDDAFDKTSKQFSNDKHILDHLYSYITLNKVKLFFTMRNTVRHRCKMLFSTHKLFHDLVDIDLNSEKFKLTAKEKEEMFTNYCAINKIRISEKENDDTAQPVANEAERAKPEDNQLVPEGAAVILKREIINEIIQTDPFLGFPECCRLFTEDRNSTHLDTSCSKWPSTILVNDIEKLRMEGTNNYVNGLKYVILIYVLTKGYQHQQYESCFYRTNRALVKENIDSQDFKQFFQICYNMNVEVHTSDIVHVCKVLTERYLGHRDGAYHFQHKAIEDSVLISYSRINIKAIIPLLSFDHVVDIVRLQNYTEQEDEIVIKILKPYYPELATKIISSLFSQIDPHRFLESKLITENDVDLIYQLIFCIQNEKVILDYYDQNFVIHFLPLYLLRSTGKLDDKLLTVNHTKYQMSISVTIGDKNITLSIDPHIALNEACI